MATTILKPDLDEDFYVVWSNSSGGPSLWGTRAEVLDGMARPASGCTASDSDPARFDRADLAGTSLYDVTEPFTGQVVGGRHWIPRDRITEWCRAGLDSRYLKPIETGPSPEARRRAAAADAADG